MWLIGEPPCCSTADYPRPGLETVTSLADRWPEFRGHRLGARDVARADALLRRLEAQPTYLILSPYQERYARLYGLFPKGSIASFGRALEDSDDFRLAFRSGDSRVFEFVPFARAGSRQ